MEGQYILSDHEIKGYLDQGHQIVDPVDEYCIQPASIDLRLGNKCFEYTCEEYELGAEIKDSDVQERTFSSYALQPFQAVHVSVGVEINMPASLAGIIFPRSSITRLGILIPPVYMNPGYRGTPPLNVVNHSARQVLLRPGVRIAQLVLFTLKEVPSKLYPDVVDSKYHCESASYSLLHQDAEAARLLDDILGGRRKTFYQTMQEKFGG